MGHGHRYRGHRADSFVASDVNELIELRARQRTFDGAYRRTALGNMGYAITILRLFDRRFYRIGLLYVILSGLLFLLAFIRAQHSNHDFSDKYLNYESSKDGADDYPHKSYKWAIPTVGQEDKRVYGRPFVTAGWIMLAVGFVVAAVEIGLLVLVLKI